MIPRGANEHITECIQKSLAPFHIKMQETRRGFLIKAAVFGSGLVLLKMPELWPRTRTEILVPLETVVPSLKPMGFPRFEPRIFLAEANSVENEPELAQEAYRLVNWQRLENNRPALHVSSFLEEIADERANDMAARSYFNHTTPEGKTFVDALQSRGIHGVAAGEIIGRTNGSRNQAIGLIMQSFLISPSHRTALLRETYSYMGGGCRRHLKSSMVYLVIIFLGGPVDESWQIV